MTYTAILYIGNFTPSQELALPKAAEIKIKETSNWELKRERVFAYALLAEAYRDIYGEELPRLYFLDSGKPCLVKKNVHISISHSGQYCAVSYSEKPVGVDVEENESVKKHSNAINRFVNNDLQSDLLSLPSLDVKHLFYTVDHGKIIKKESEEKTDEANPQARLWTLLEAVMKTGEGFAEYPRVKELLHNTTAHTAALSCACVSTAVKI